jgi:arabinogalactan oligomer/maltooligosaccharide transport system substrate-binding protein
LDQSPASLSGTITLWHAYGPGSAEETALNQVIQDAESANPGLDIVPEYHDLGQIYGDYESAVLGGGGPDMYIAPNDSLGNQVRSGVVLNIDGYLQGQLSTVEQKAIDGMKVDGLLYGVPESAKAVALYYNSSMIDTPPTTTAELFTLLQGDETLSSPANAYHFYGLWSAFGGQLMDGTGRCVADQGGFVDAMHYLLDLQAAGAAFSDYGTAESMFLNGQTGMLINGPWALASYEDALGADLGVAVLPDGPSGDAEAMNGIDGFYVNPNSSNPANVVQAALLLTNQASSQVWTDVGGHIPVRSDVTSSDPLISAFAQASAGSEPRPQNVELNNYWGPFQEMIDKVLGGNETPAVGIQRACNTMNVLNGFTPSTNTITLWHAYPTGGGEESALNQIIDSAEAADPDLTVVAIQHSFADIYTDYENAVLGGGGPDMYIAPNDNLGNQARNDTILNIDSYLQGKLTNVGQTAIDAMKVNGALYGVPESAKAVALYYNTSMIAAPPTTTAEL